MFLDILIPIYTFSCPASIAKPEPEKNQIDTPQGHCQEHLNRVFGKLWCKGSEEKANLEENIENNIPYRYIYIILLFIQMEF